MQLSDFSEFIFFRSAEFQARPFIKPIVFDIIHLKIHKNKTNLIYLYSFPLYKKMKESKAILILTIILIIEIANI